MTKRRVFALVLALCLLLSGCSLAQPEDETTVGEDKMVGVLVTTQPLDLFDIESYVNDNAGTILRGGQISQTDAARYQDRLFAEWDEAAQAYVFPQTQGYVLLNTRRQDDHGGYENLQTDDIFCHTRTALSYTDEGAQHEFSATIYAEAKNNGSCSVFVNPLFQMEDGRVYVQSGTGISTNTDEHSRVSMSKTVTQTTRQMQNGETTQHTFHCEITVQLTPAPTGAELFWMTTQDGILRREHYAPGELPPELDAQGAEFLLVVEHFADGSSTQTVFNADSTDSPGALTCAEEGLLKRHSCTVTWGDAD